MKAAGCKIVKLRETSVSLYTATSQKWDVRTHGSATGDGNNYKETSDQSAAKLYSYEKG